LGCYCTVLLHRSAVVHPAETGWGTREGPPTFGFDDTRRKNRKHFHNGKQLDHLFYLYFLLSPGTILLSRAHTNLLRLHPLSRMTNSKMNEIAFGCHWISKLKLQIKISEFVPFSRNATIYLSSYVFLDCKTFLGFSLHSVETWLHLIVRTPTTQIGINSSRRVKSPWSRHTQVKPL